MARLFVISVLYLCKRVAAASTTICMCLQVSELQGSVQELQEALDQEAAAHREAQGTLEEAFHHRRALEAK